jgi:putative hydrolase of the HAD superfamily
MTIKAVFFDLDDTLLNTSGSRRERAEIAARFLVEADPSLTVDGVVARILEPVSEDGWPRGVGSVLVELGQAHSPHGLRAYGAWFFEDCEHLVYPFEGAADTLAALGGRYTLGVITNGPTAVQRRKYEALCIEAHSRPELFVPSELVGYQKPDARIFHHALKLAGVAASEAVMVGDWLAADVVGAQNAGMRGVWFNPHGRPVPDGASPDAIIRRFEELPGVLAKWA